MAANPVERSDLKPAVANETPSTDVLGMVVRVAGAVASGGLTDAELRATPVPVSGTVSVNEPVTVDAVNLDIRDLVFATDKVDVSGSTGVGVTGPLTDVQLRATPVPVSGTVSVTEPVTVDAVDLDIRNLVFATDKVDVSGSTGVGVTGTFFQATQPVSAVSLPLPTGAATLAAQTQPGVDIGDVTINNGAGASAVNIQDGGNAITVDGAVTATVSATNLDIRDLVFATDRVDASGTVLGAGDNNIGNVDVVTLPALAAGDNTVGRVKLTDGTDVADILDLTNSNPLTVAIVDGSGDQITSFGGGTQYTEDAAAAANPIGTATILVRQDTPATLTTTDGDNVAQRGTNYGGAYTQIVTSAGAFVDSFGGGTQYTEGDTDATITGTAVMWEDAGDTLRVVSAAKPLPIGDAGGSLTVDGTVGLTKSATSTLTNVASSATNVTLLASNASRNGAAVFNDSTKVLYVKLGATASATSFTVKMLAASYFEVPFHYTGIIDGIWATANGSARVTELT